MRFLSINNLHLGARTAGLPAHLAHDLPAASSRDALGKAVDIALEQHVHAVLLTGDVISPHNNGLEPLGALRDALHTLQRTNIPVVAVARGNFTRETVDSLGLADAVTFVDDRLAWNPPIVTHRDHIEGGAIHILPAAFGEESQAGDDVLAIETLDAHGAIWILTNPLQPDALLTEHSLVLEPGSPIALSATDINRHGVWLVDTDSLEATLIPIAAIEFAAIDVDVSPANNLDDAERLIIEALVEAADISAADSSAAHNLLVDVTLVGATRLYPSLEDLGNELTRMLHLEHNGVEISITDLHIDATPDIDLEPLLQRPDPLGELARLIEVLESDAEPTAAQQAIIAAAEQRLIAVRHARVFGAVHDTDTQQSTTALLKSNAWALLDSLVRQRGIHQ